MLKTVEEARATLVKWLSSQGHTNVVISGTEITKHGWRIDTTVPFGSFHVAKGDGYVTDELGTGVIARK